MSNDINFLSFGCKTDAPLYEHFVDAQHHGGLLAKAPRIAATFLRKEDDRDVQKTAVEIALEYASNEKGKVAQMLERHRDQPTVVLIGSERETFHQRNPHIAVQMRKDIALAIAEQKDISLIGDGKSGTSKLAFEIYTEEMAKYRTSHRRDSSSKFIRHALATITTEYSAPKKTSTCGHYQEILAPEAVNIIGQTSNLLSVGQVQQVVVYPFGGREFEIVGELGLFGQMHKLTPNAFWKRELPRVDFKNLPVAIGMHNELNGMPFFDPYIAQLQHAADDRVAFSNATDFDHFFINNSNDSSSRKLMEVSTTWNANEHSYVL